jgi:aryl-alcohol dehydrogenase-like predicted oxidoreductase
MKIKRMGRTGLKVSEICLGTMTFGHQCDEPTAFAIMDHAWQGGVNFIDTSDAYPFPPALATAGGTETIIGHWFAAHPGRRHETVLATKCIAPMSAAPNDQGLSRRHNFDATTIPISRFDKGSTAPGRR